MTRQELMFLFRSVSYREKEIESQMDDARQDCVSRRFNLIRGEGRGYKMVTHHCLGLTLV